MEWPRDVCASTTDKNTQIKLQNENMKGTNRIGSAVALRETTESERRSPETGKPKGITSARNSYSEKSTFEAQFLNIKRFFMPLLPSPLQFTRCYSFILVSSYFSHLLIIGYCSARKSNKKIPLEIISAELRGGCVALLPLLLCGFSRHFVNDVIDGNFRSC